MINPRDLHTQFESYELTDANNKAFGRIKNDIFVSQYQDVRNSNLVRSYIIEFQQRIEIYGGGANIGTATTTYSDYPVALINQLSPTLPAGATGYVNDYKPKTLNAAIMANVGVIDNAGNTSSTSQQQTSGSSTSETNSFEAGVNLGFFGNDPTGGLSLSYGHSDTTTRERSLSLALSHGSENSRSASSSDSMSIKDWGSYGAANSDQSVCWTWGQTYPWDPIQAHNITNTVVDLPGYVAARLWNSSDQVYPPSHISVFGLNFLSAARWVISLPGAAGAANETLTFSQSVTLFRASHSLESTNQNPPANRLHVVLDEPITPALPATGSIDLVALALDPILDGGANNGAVIGFARPQFIFAPDASGAFRILSGANNLSVSGTGFAPLTADDQPLQSTFAGAAQATLHVEFKLLDLSHSLSLVMKHWKIGTPDLLLSIKINGGDTMTRYVDAAEASAGDDNLCSVILQNHDYASPEFFDFLRLGRNTIDIMIAPVPGASSDGSPPTAGYALRAIAIG